MNGLAFRASLFKWDCSITAKAKSSAVANDEKERREDTVRIFVTGVAGWDSSVAAIVSSLRTGTKPCVE